MNKIEGDIQAALDELVIEVGLIVLKMGFGSFGDIDTDVALEISGALGHAIDSVAAKAIDGAYS